jgi:hypothetical protein
LIVTLLAYSLFAAQTTYFFHFDIGNFIVNNADTIYYENTEWGFDSATIANELSDIVNLGLVMKWGNTWFSPSLGIPFCDYGFNAIPIIDMQVGRCLEEFSAYLGYQHPIVHRRKISKASNEFTIEEIIGSKTAYGGFQYRIIREKLQFSMDVQMRRENNYYRIYNYLLEEDVKKDAYNQMVYSFKIGYREDGITPFAFISINNRFGFSTGIELGFGFTAGYLPVHPAKYEVRKISSYHRHWLPYH